MKKPTNRELAVFGVPASKPNAVVGSNPHRLLSQTAAEKSMAEWLTVSTKQRKTAS